MSRGDDLSCALTLNATGSKKKELEPLEPFNWDDRWLESYKDQMYTLGIKSTTAKLAELAVGGIWGEFVSLFIGIFFPPPGHKQSLALLKIVQKWTEKYVGKQQAALVRDLAEASLDTAKNTLEKQYEPPSAELLAAVEVAKKYTPRPFRRPPVFPEQAWSQAEQASRGHEALQIRLRT